METILRKAAVLLLSVVFIVLTLSPLLVVPVSGVTTFEMHRVFSASNYDGGLVGYNATSYSTAHNQATGTVTSWFEFGVGQENTTATNIYIYRGVIPFDTSLIPDSATNINLTLSINCFAVDGSDNITVVMPTSSLSSCPSAGRRLQLHSLLRKYRQS